MQWLFWVVAIIAAVLTGLLVYRADARKAVPFPWLTAGLRSAAILLTAMLLLFPAFTITKNITEKPLVIHLQDNSVSVGAALRGDTASYRQQTEKMLAALTEKFRVVRLSFGGRVRKDTTALYDQSSTDISSAIEHVREYYGLDNIGAVILATDGLFNRGVSPLYQDIPSVGGIYTIAIGDSSLKKDLLISRTYANKQASLNTSFEIRADINAALCNGFTGEALLKEGNTTVGSVPLNVTGQRYDRAISFIVKSDKPGLHHYTVVLPEATGEENTANNRRDVFVEITEEKKKLLIVYAAPHPDVNAIKEAIEVLPNYAVTVVPVENMSSNLASFDAIVLHGLPTQRVEISARLKQAAKPVWFILTGQTNIPTLNSLSNVYGINIQPLPATDLLPAVNTSFNLFNLPASLPSVADNLPPLSVYAAKIFTTPAGFTFLQAKGTAQDGSIRDIWTLMQGNTNAAILAGEGIWRWRLYEFKTFGKHDVVDECIRQTVAFLVAGNRNKPFTISLPKQVWKDNEPVSLRALLKNVNLEPVNTPEVVFTVADSAGTKHTYNMERSGNGYNLNLGVWAGGNYSFTAKTEYNGKPLIATGSFIVESTPVELLDTRADYQMLYSLAKKYRGAFSTYKNVAAIADSINANKELKPLIQQNVEIVPLVDKKWYFFIILLILTAEWLLRKYWMAQ